MSCSLPVYLHFLDRELLSTLGLYDVTKEEVIVDDLIILLLGSYEELFFSASLAFENKFARHIMSCYPLLFQRGHINLIMREMGFEHFIETKKEQYGYSKGGYEFYFDDTWQSIAAISPSIIHRAIDTTKYLERGITSDLKKEEIANTTKRIGSIARTDEIFRLAPYIEESIYERGSKAITKRLFGDVYSKQSVSTNAKLMYNLKISEHYIGSYIGEFEGTIVTGIKNAVDYFSYLCPSFPCHHLPLWKAIYRKIGCLSIFHNFTDHHLITTRESPEFIRFVDTIRTAIKRILGEEQLSYSLIPGKWFRDNVLDNIRTIPKKIDGYEEFLLTLEGITEQLENSFANNCSNLEFERRLNMKQNVFVVYGRNKPTRRAVFDLLRSAGLKPMEWDQIVALTGKGSPYVGEILDKGLDVAQAIVVLFTGDDLAKIDPELLDDGDNEEELTPQPRPNVILEAGMALAKNPDRTIIVQIGSIRDISDLTGRHVIRLSNTVESRKQLLDRLKTAGCNVDLIGNDWMTAGDL